MDPIYYFWAVYLAMWIVITVAWWGLGAQRFGITGLPLYLLYRTTRLNNLIDRIATGLIQDSDDAPRAATDRFDDSS